MTAALILLSLCYQPHEVNELPTYTEHYATGFCHETRLYAIYPGDFVTREWPDGSVEYLIGTGQERGLVEAAFLSREYWQALFELEGRR